PQFPERVDVAERARAGRPRIVCVGRVNESVKRQWLLVEAFGKIARDFPEWSLYFFGKAEKPQFLQRLEEMIAQKDLGGQVFICAPTNDVKGELLKSDVFAFPSAFEGFPLALTEAKSAGLPVVGFRDAPAVNELIRDGIDGFLADDVDDFAEKLRILMKSPELRAKFGAAGKKDCEQYAPKIVWDQWEALLRRVVEERAKRRA
ncbi:MAG: glycosyltransferase, partial [Thermoguttaceae bacterium]|nr:glycosyltransferase [Thermoguttaceae bacterium]